jgi:serine protease Do
VYGRFGSWQHQKDPLNKTTAGFKKALEAGLALHKGYPANKALLARKQGEPTPYKTPIEFPSLSEKYPSKLDWGGKVVQSCVHCHMIGDAYRAYYRQETKVVPAEWICPQPSIETLGVTLATDDAARVEAVAPGSAGAAAGLQVGDTLLTLNAQPLISIADVSWVLHRAPESGRLPATVQRGGNEIAVSLELPAGWRSKSDISKRVGTWPMRAMAFGGLKMADLDDAGRASAGLTPEGMALRVEHVGEYGAHAAAKKEGFKANDVLLQVGDEKGRLSESALIGWLLQTHRPGEKLPVVVLRGSERLTLQLPQQ